MVKLTFSGTDMTDQAHGALGFLSFHFSGYYGVEDATSTGFTVTFSFPSLPIALPLDDQAPDQYVGVGLTYVPLTFNGVTLQTPFSGTITEVHEEADDYSSHATGLNLAASDFYRVSATEDNSDNVELTKSVFSGDDRMKGGAGKDKMDGFDGNDVLAGRGGNDLLWGSDGADSLLGGAGKDKLFGGDDADVLKGGGGKDQLDGGAGDDRMKGGGGADSFVFSAGRDLILDFQNDIDRVRLEASALGIDDTLTGAQVVSTFGTMVDGSAALDFGGGNTLIFKGITDLGLIADDLQIL